MPIHPPTEDTEFYEQQIDKVSGRAGSWVLTLADGFCFGGIPATWSGTPKPGTIARFYGRRFGFVRGLLLNEEVVFYRSPDEERARQDEKLQKQDEERRSRYEKDRVRFEERTAALPEDLRERIEKFRAVKGNTWRYAFEPYELMCCEDAVKIHALGSVAEIERFAKLDFTEQLKLIPTLNDGHSGNSFSCAVHLAVCLFTPGLAQKQHGALALLVGCKEYGCH